MPLESPSWRAKQHLQHEGRNPAIFAHRLNDILAIMCENYPLYQYVTASCIAADPFPRYSPGTPGTKQQPLEKPFCRHLGRQSEAKLIRETYLKSFTYLALKFMLKQTYITETS